MGMLDRLRPPTVEAWHPPSLGTCRCEWHIEDLLEHEIPLADGSGWVFVRDVVAAGGLTVVPTPDALWIDGARVNERHGPFHWRVFSQRELDRFYDDEAPTRLDDALFVQPGVESVLWLSHRSVLAVGAPRLCNRGVQGAVVRSLLNDRIRSILS
jgi:hypothetical protein